MTSRTPQPPLLPYQYLFRAVLIALAVLVFLILFFQNPERPLGVMPCVFHSITGLPCAFCGGTRSACAITHGMFQRALELNALAFPALGLILATALIALVEIFLKRALADWSAMGRQTFKKLPLILALIFIWWIPHIIHAVKSSSNELANLKNPIAQYFHNWLNKP